MFQTPTPAELRRGCAAYEKHERRDSMYRVATFLLDRWWGDHAAMVDALTVLLLTWNQAFYRFGLFDQAELETCLKEHWIQIEAFHHRQIGSFSEPDHAAVKPLFMAFLRALRIASGKARGRRSPVAVAKTLHLLASAFFPPWDDAIARAYDCPYIANPAEAYVRF